MLAASITLATPASAEILQYRFTDTVSGEKTVVPAYGYINPKATFTTLVSAGIDRKIKLSLLKQDGAPVSHTTSKLIGSADLITVDGKSYYGVSLALAKPADGVYTLRAETLSSQDAIVASESVALTIDTAAPELGEWSWDVPYGNGFAPDGLPIFSQIGAKFIALAAPNISDIDKATYQTYEHLSASNIKEVRSGILGVPSTSPIMIGTGSNTSIPDSILPTKVQGRYSIKINVQDKAGNVASKTLDFYNNSKCGAAPEAVAIEDDTYTGSGFQGVSGFRPLNSESQNLVVKSPTRVMFKIASNEVRANPEGAIYGGSVGLALEYTIVKTVDGVTYFIAKENIQPNGEMNWNAVGWTNHATFRCSALKVPNPVFTDAAKPLVLGQAIPYIEGYGWLPQQISTKGGTYARNLTISKIKIFAEPRTYEQEAITSFGRCLITAGNDQCEFSSNLPYNTTGTAGKYDYRYYITKKSDATVRVYPQQNLLWEWDAADPIIDKLENHNTLTKQVSFIAIKPEAGANYGRVNLKQGGLIAKSATGEKITLTASEMLTTGTTSKFTTSYKPLRSGTWQIFGWAEDIDGNFTEKFLFDLQNDADAPKIAFLKSGSKIASLDDITVKVNDDQSAKPRITSVKLSGGPANGEIYLATSETEENTYRLEYPVIFPSFGSSYTLTVTAIDDVGNVGTNNLSFLYEPATTGLEEENFSIPSIGRYAWSHKDGRLPFSSKQLTNYEGNVLTGSYNLTATLRPDSTSGPISVNGVVLAPGDTKDIGSVNFTETDGKISLPVFAQQDGSVGTANLLISSGAPGASVVFGTFNVWSPKVSVDLTKTNLKGRALLDTFSIGLKDDSGKCVWKPKDDIQNTSSVDIISSPPCFNTAIESGLEYYEAKNYATLYSLLAQVSKTTLPAGMASGAKIKGTYLNSAGVREQVVVDIPVSSDGLELDVQDASGAIKFGNEGEKISVYRSIQSVDQSLTQTSGPSCGSITGNEEDAVASGARMSPQKGISSIACYFKWTSTPPGMVTGDNEQQGFNIKGTIPELGTFPISWELVAYTPLGKHAPVILSRQSMSVEVVNPPAPSIAIQSNRAVSDSVFTVQKKPTNIGVVNITGVADGAVVYKVLREGIVIADSSDKAEYAKKTATYRLNSEAQTKLWAAQSYSLQASYVKLPDIIATKEIKTVTVPDDDMSMKVSTEVNKALSSSTVPVTIGFYNKSNVNTSYSVEDAGEWSVRLVDVKSAKNRVPLSSWTPVSSDGTVTIDLPLGMSAGDMMHVGSEGTLSSKLDGFEMSKASANTITLTVLDASPVEGNLKSYKVSGVAPLSVSTSIVSGQKNLISEVQWQISHDDGATWTVIDGAPTVASKMLSNTYDAGIHKVRAKLKNRYSGVESYTSILEVQAYHVPDARFIDGPAVMLVGQSGKKHVTNREGARLTDSEGIVFEWSTDRGETWLTKSNEFDFNQTADIGNYPLWARMRYATSPQGDSYAYKVVKTMVSVRKTAKVTVGLVGTTQPEVNKSNIYSATVKLPYSNMQGELVGQFTLPDGSTVDGFTLDYRPKEAVTGNQLISFDAWIKGYEADSKRSVSKKLRAWEYAWPVFTLRQIQDPNSYAPTTLDLRVENLGSLNRIEGLTYTWELPESDTFVSADSRIDTRRVAKITEPGSYPVKVTISDDRGNLTVLEQNLAIAEPPPWVVDMAWTGSNPSNRAILGIRTKPQITRGHKYDSITGYTYKVNGVEAGTSTRYTNLSLTEPGRYVLSLDLTTELGFGGYGSTIIDVVENKKPECSLDVKQTSTAYVVTSKCTDPDGKMASYEWLVNGEQQSIRGSSISISKRTYPSQPKIQLTGIDDSGGRSEPISW